MAYLFPKDYKVAIQDVNIQQIITSDESIRNQSQLSGEAEAQSYLKQKYDISEEFQSINPFALNTQYFATNRVYLDGAAWQLLVAYSVNAIVSNQGKVYICIQANTGQAVTNTAYWTLIGNQYDVFHVKLPYNEFNYRSYYNVGDFVFWKNKTYKCLIQTPVLSHDVALQYRTIQNLPAQNVPPDEPQNGSKYWQFISNYSTTNNLPTDTAYWVNGDNRDAQMVLYCCDIVLYHLHARIAPRNIPDLRVKRYDDAIKWLKMCAVGDVTPNLPVLQPMQGMRIRYGGNIKQINSY